MGKFFASRLERTDAVRTTLWREDLDFSAVAPEVVTVEPAAAGVISIQAVSNDPDYLNGRTWSLYGDQTTRVNIYAARQARLGPRAMSGR